MPVDNEPGLDSDLATTQSKPSDGPVTLAEFLETQPPGSSAKVRDVAGRMQPGGTYTFQTTDIRLHCPSRPCSGVRTFRVEKEPAAVSTGWVLRFLTYVCRNCEESLRVYALRIRVDPTNPLLCDVRKFGELPPYGPPVPARVITLIGPDRDLFTKGRRCENQGLGVGAFAYYRRVVDNQWRRLVAEIIRVAETTRAPQPMIDALKAAAEETQFSKAVEMIKEGIPEVLKVSGHNPLTLLYAAISDGLHDGTDQHCLDLAASVRVVLTELAERLGQALKDEKELNTAVSNLLAKRGPKLGK